MTKVQNRIFIVDALRGFALMCIMLLHSVEHFDFLLKPTTPLFFSSDTDTMVMDTLMLLFGGKAYAIFALLFGLSFFIQMDRQSQDNIDFRPRFVWRLLILLGFGFVHSLIYRGDILQIYAILGMVMVIVDRYNNKTISVLICLLVLQIPLLIQFFYACLHPEYEYVKTIGNGLGKIAKDTYANGSFADVIQFNIWNGRVTNWAWTYYNGRYMQLLALFFLGLILGRKKFFENISVCFSKIRVVLLVSLILTLVLIVFNKNLDAFELTKAQLKLAQILTKSFADISQTIFYVSGFIWLYERGILVGFMRSLSHVGRMSLSNYLIQAVFGVIIFYGFGLGLYRYLGASWSIMYGVAFFVLQVFVSKWWMKKYYYGPAEWLWRALTFGDFNIPFKRNLNK